MEKNMDVVALGELLIDFTCNGVSTQSNPIYEANPGGAPCNVLAMLAKLGRRTAFIGKVGDDQFGVFLRQIGMEAGIDMRALVMDDKVHTTLAFVKTADNGDRDFSFYRDPGADTFLTSDEVPEELISRAKIFHFGSLSLTGEPVRSATQKAVTLARESGAVISFDPNLRPQLWPDQQTMIDFMNEVAAQSDVFLPGIAEAKLLCGQEEPEAIAAHYLAAGAKLVIVKVGSKGACYASAQGSGLVPGFTVKKVVDTVGAGDGFAAGVLSALMEGLPVAEAVRRGNAVGAIQVMSRGDNDGLPTREQLETFMKEE